MGRNGSHSSGSGTGRDFPPVFSWDWDGKRFIFVGVGREEIHFCGSGTGRDSFLWEWDGKRFIFVGVGREEIHFCGSGTGEVWEFTPVSPSNTHPAYTLWRKIRSFIVKERDTWQHTHIKPPLVDSQHRTAALSFTSSHRKQQTKAKANYQKHGRSYAPVWIYKALS